MPEPWNLLAIRAGSVKNLAERMNVSLRQINYLAYGHRPLNTEAEARLGGLLEELKQDPRFYKA